MMESYNYTALYEKEQGIYFHFKRYVIYYLLPLFLIIFVILNAILLIAYQEWKSSTKQNKRIFKLFFGLVFSKNNSYMESKVMKELFRLSSERIHIEMLQVQYKNRLCFINPNIYSLKKLFQS